MTSSWPSGPPNPASRIASYANDSVTCSGPRDAAGVAPNYTVLSTGAPYAATELVQNHGHWAVHKDYQALQDDLRLNFSLREHQLTTGIYYADYSMADRWSLGNLLLSELEILDKSLVASRFFDCVQV